MQIKFLIRKFDTNVLFKILFFAALTFFAVLYSFESIIPHSNFRTYALDLGMFNHALYSYAHLKANYFTLAIDGTEIPYLGDHFSPLTMLYAPFYYLFGTYTLLILQIASILFGAYGVYKYAVINGINKWIALLLFILFLTLWGIHSALKFDFHNNVIAAMLVPWFVIYFEKGNLRLSILFFVMILLAKENMALWMVFIILCLLLNRHTKASRIKNFHAIWMIGFSIIYFVLAVNVFMPYYSKGLGTDQFSRFTHLGDSLSDMINTIFEKPQLIFAMFFEDTLDSGEVGIKSGLWFIFLVSGGFAVFANPRYLIMLLPVAALKMLSSNPSMWGTNAQYSIEMVPIVGLSLVSFLKAEWHNYLKVGLLVILIWASYYYYLDENDRRVTDAFKKEYYKPDLNNKNIRKNLKLIPHDAIISVSSALAPHLAFRDKIYHFPFIKNAEFVALLKNRSHYPLNNEQFIQEVMKLKADTNNKLLVEDEDLLIFKVKPQERVTINIDTEADKAIQKIMDDIKSSPEYMKMIEEKAKKNNIPVDSMLYFDAQYIYSSSKK